MKRWMFAMALIVGGLAAPARAADVDPLLPADTMNVVKLNVKQILESEIIKKYALAQLKQALEGKDAAEKLKELGLDPLKDIESLTAGFWNPGDDPKDTHGLMVLRGKFDAEKLFAAVEKAIAKDGDKMSIVKEGDVKLIKIVVDNMPEPVYATMANDKTIIVATEKKLVLNAIKIADDKNAKPAVKSELAELVKGMDEKASLAFVGLATGKVGDIPPNPIFDDVEKLKKQLENVVSSGMTLRVGTDISMEFTLAMKNKEAADDFGETVKELLEKARTFLPLIAMGQPNAKPLVDDVKKNLKSSVETKNVKMSVKITGDAIGKMTGAEE